MKDINDYKPCANMRAISFSFWLNDWCAQKNISKENMTEQDKDDFISDTNNTWGDFFKKG